MAGMKTQRPNPKVPLGADAVAAGWKDLGSADAKAAFRAIRLLVEAPDQSLPLLRKHLRPAPAADLTAIDRWLAELDSARFSEREEAMRQLERQGSPAEAPVRGFLAGKPSLEARQRAEQVLARLRGPVTDPDRLRQLRALETLEYIGNAEARQILRELSGGVGEAKLTQDAAATLRRLDRRP
jgi:HEAT repeat protein